MASGSQTWSGNWALLPTQPAKIPRPAIVSIQNGICRGSPGDAVVSTLPVSRSTSWTTSRRRNRGRRSVVPMADRNPWLISWKPKVPRLVQSKPRPTSIPTSPTRLTMNALLAASQLTFSSYQKPISRYEQTPTSSQKMKIMKTFDEATRPSIEKQKSDR